MERLHPQGDRLQTPSFARVDTNAMGRGTMLLIISLYTSTGGTASGEIATKSSAACGKGGGDRAPGRQLGFGESCGSRKGAGASAVGGGSGPSKRNVPGVPSGFGRGKSNTERDCPCCRDSETFRVSETDSAANRESVTILRRRLLQAAQSAGACQRQPRPPPYHTLRDLRGRSARGRRRSST